MPAYLIAKFSEMGTRWVPYRIVSDDHTRQPRWPPQPIDLSLTQNPIGNSLTNFLVWNYLLIWKQTLVEWSLGWFLSELYPMILSANRHSQTRFNIFLYIFLPKNTCSIKLELKYMLLHNAV